MVLDSELKYEPRMESEQDMVKMSLIRVYGFRFRTQI